MALTKITSASVKDGELVNADLHTAANIDGSKLADDSVSLAKLEHGTSSNNGKFLRANNGADPTFETISNQSLEYPNGTNAVLTSTNDVVEINGKVNWDNDPNNTYGISFDAPTTLTKNSNYILPEDGNAGEFLKTDGSGNLSFAKASSPEVYGFNTNASGNLIVTTTNGGADNISGTAFDAFEDVIFAATGFTFSVNANGKLIATI